jgi:hypothetical protein
LVCLTWTCSARTNTKMNITITKVMVFITNLHLARYQLCPGILARQPGPYCSEVVFVFHDWPSVFYFPSGEYSRYLILGFRTWSTVLRHLVISTRSARITNKRIKTLINKRVSTTKPPVK